MTPEVIAKTVAAWEQEPDKARSSPTITARAEGGQAVIEAGPFSLRTDLPAPLGGSNEAPSPTALLLSALAGCAVVFVRDTLGPLMGVRIDHVEATARCDADARGLLGLAGVLPDLSNVAVDVTIRSPDGPDAVAAVAEVWKQRCPIYLALQNPLDVAVTFRAAEPG